jgi:hypothetical protein
LVGSDWKIPVSPLSISGGSSNVFWPVQWIVNVLTNPFKWNLESTSNPITVRYYFFTLLKFVICH